MPKLSFNVSYYYIFITYNQFYEQFLKLNKILGNNLNLSLKITYKDKITDIKKNSVQNSYCCQFTLMRQFLSFFRQFPKPLANTNNCIFVNIAWKMNCDILKSKLILCE